MTQASTVSAPGRTAAKKKVTKVVKAATVGAGEVKPLKGEKVKRSVAKAGAAAKATTATRSPEKPAASTKRVVKQEGSPAKKVKKREIATKELESHPIDLTPAPAAKKKKVSASASAPVTGKKVVKAKKTAVAAEEAAVTKKKVAPKKPPGLKRDAAAVPAKVAGKRAASKPAAAKQLREVKGPAGAVETKKKKKTTAKKAAVAAGVAAAAAAPVAAVAAGVATRPAAEAEKPAAEELQQLPDAMEGSGSREVAYEGLAEEQAAGAAVPEDLVGAEAELVEAGAEGVEVGQLELLGSSHWPDLDAHTAAAEAGTGLSLEGEEEGVEDQQPEEEKEEDEDMEEERARERAEEEDEPGIALSAGAAGLLAGAGAVGIAAAAGGRHDEEAEEQQMPRAAAGAEGSWPLLEEELLEEAELPAAGGAADEDSAEQGRVSATEDAAEVRPAVADDVSRYLEEAMADAKTGDGMETWRGQLGPEQQDALEAWVAEEDDDGYLLLASDAAKKLPAEPDDAAPLDADGGAVVPQTPEKIVDATPTPASSEAAAHAAAGADDGQIHRSSSLAPGQDVTPALAVKEALEQAGREMEEEHQHEAAALTLDAREGAAADGKQPEHGEGVAAAAAAAAGGAAAAAAAATAAATAGAAEGAEAPQDLLMAPGAAEAAEAPATVSVEPQAAVLGADQVQGRQELPLTPAPTQMEMLEPVAEAPEAALAGGPLHGALEQQLEIVAAEAEELGKPADRLAEPSEGMLATAEAGKGAGEGIAAAQESAAAVPVVHAMPQPEMRAEAEEGVDSEGGRAVAAVAEPEELARDRPRAAAGGAVQAETEPEAAAATAVEGAPSGAAEAVEKPAEKAKEVKQARCCVIM